MGKLGTGGTGATEVLRDCGPSSRAFDGALVIACPRLPDENTADTLGSIRESLRDIRDHLDDVLDLVGLLLHSHDEVPAGTGLKFGELVHPPSRFVNAEPSASKCLTRACDSMVQSLSGAIHKEFQSPERRRNERASSYREEVRPIRAYASRTKGEIHDHVGDNGVSPGTLGGLVDK